MTMRFYLMPLTGAGTRDDKRRPAYAETDLLGLDWRLMDYGLEPVAVVQVEVSGAGHTALAAHADVLAFPADLETVLGAGAVPAIQNALDAAHLPSDWVQVGLTARQVLRRIVRAFLFFQRLHAVLPARLFQGAVTLDTVFQDLPLARRQALHAAAGGLGWDLSTVTGTMTMREILTILVGQQSRDILVGTETL